MSLPDYEKLGLFYLGHAQNPETNELTSDLVLYDSKDLTTHAVCVGMTGSGKTGLCLSLLEEAAIDRIPVIAIDPKGDLGNLMLTFPELSAEEFRPWIDESEALRKGQTIEEFAQATADRWREGLAASDQSAERIQRFREAAEVSIYTPGSDAGLPLSVLQSFTAPTEAVINDSDAFRDRILSAVSSLLALLKIDADPISSREHILLSHILSTAWQAGHSLTIPQILHQIQQPPFQKVGFMDLETFFPEKDRFQFALAVNNLLASPGFAAWMQGEPLDIERLLITPAGKPRISILSIAHLSEPERMFFVTILLNELLSWVRSQPGTSSLRAILYMDEVFGYFPPTANPPSKKPMLTLLKQARAYGVGIVLATQNPVDLDYKGLSNTGTWFLGRLQTERDKARVIEGLESAAGATGTAFNRQEMLSILSGLGQRKFLLHNVHEQHPIVFQTRWALSYLRGPLTRQQISTVMAEQKAASQQVLQAKQTKTQHQSVTKSDSFTTSEDSAPEMEGFSRIPPALSDSLVQRFLVISRPLPKSATLIYQGGLLGLVKVHYVDSKSNIDLWREAALIVTEYEEAAVDTWDHCELHWKPDLGLESAPAPDAHFAELAPDLARTTKYRTWRKQLRDHIYREITLPLWYHEATKLYSQPAETESGFRLRVVQSLREQSDLAVEKLKGRYESKFSTLRDRVLRAEQRVKKEQAQYKEQSYFSFVSIGSSILGAILGRKIASRTNVSKAATAMRSAGKMSSSKEDVQQAIEKLQAEQAKLQELEQQFEDEVSALDQPINPQELVLESYPVRPRKGDITVVDMALLWLPYALNENQTEEPLFEIVTSAKSP